MGRSLSVLLVVLNLALGCGLGWLWFDDAGNLKNMHWVAPVPVKPEIPTWSQNLQKPTTDNNAFLNVLERPLFSPSRRPPPPPPPPAAPPPPDPLQGVQILGVFGSGDTGGVLAVIQGRMRRVAKGELVGEWLLKAVSDRDATFDKKGEARVIGLTNAKLTSATGAAPVYKSAPAQARPPDPAQASALSNAPPGASGPPPPPRAGGAVFGGGSARPAAPAQR